MTDRCCVCLKNGAIAYMEDGAVTKEQPYTALLQQRTGITKRRTLSSFEEVSTCVSVCYREVELASAERS